MDRLPAGAVHGHEDLRAHLLQRLNGLFDDRFELRAGEMETPKYGIEAIEP